MAVTVRADAINPLDVPAGQITTIVPAGWTGLTLRHRNRMLPVRNVADAAQITANFYMRIHDDATVSSNQSAMYVDIGAANIVGAGININLNGPHDGIYVARRDGGLGPGAGVESAAFADGSANYISTLQWTAADGTGHDFGNTVCYTGLWGLSGAGAFGSEIQPAYGVFYSNLAIGKSFSVRMQDPTIAGFAWGREEFLVRSNDLTRTHYSVTNQGELNLRGQIATAGTVNQNQAYSRTISSRWDGAANVDYGVRQTTLATGGSAVWRVLQGVVGSEVETFRCTAAGLPTFAGNSLIIATARTPASTGSIAWDANYIYVCTATNTWKRVAIASW